MMTESDVICAQTFKFVDFFLKKIDELLRFTYSVLSLRHTITIIIIIIIIIIVIIIIVVIIIIIIIIVIIVIAIIIGSFKVI